MENNSVPDLYFPQTNIVKATFKDIQTMSINAYLNMLDCISLEDKQRQIVDYRLCCGRGVVSSMWNPLTEKMTFGGIQNESYCLLFEDDIFGNILHEGLVKTVKPDNVLKILTRKYIEKYGVITGEQTDWMQAVQSSTDRCVNQILSQFPLAPWQIAIEPHRYCSSFINVTTSDVGNNIELIKKAMSFFGYFLGAVRQTDYVPYRNEIVVCKVLQFEPKFQEIITDKIKNTCEYLYHVSPKRYEKRIMSQGLCPNNRNDKFDFPPRVYLFMDRHDYLGNQDTIERRHLLGFAAMLFKNMIKKRSDEYVDDKIWNCYRIETSDLPDNTDLEIDPNLEPCAVFSTSGIKPNIIHRMYEFNLSKENI